MIRITLACVVVMTLMSPVVYGEDLTLKRIMADRDWLGNGPEQPYWADDSKSVYYRQKQPGAEQRDLLQIDLKGNPIQTVSLETMGLVDVRQGVDSPDGRWKVYARQGDIYVKNLRSGRIRQLTRTAEVESKPLFTSDSAGVIFHREQMVLVRDLESGLEVQAADLRMEDDPDAEDEDFDYLKEQQKRLFEIIRLNEYREERAEEHSRTEQNADPSRLDSPWYLGKDTEIVSTRLSPDRRWLAVVTYDSDKEKEGKDGSMPNYVTDTGYVENREVRARVGTAKFATQQLHLLNLLTREQHTIDLDSLPGIMDDPTKGLREAAEALRKKDGDSEKDGSEEADAEPKPRAIEIEGIRWNETGTQLLFQAYSLDQKDRWVVRVQPEDRTPVTIHRLHDEAWVNWKFRDADWMPDNATVYYLSEEEGYAHLYLGLPDGSSRQLTHGKFEVDSPTITDDGKFIYFRSNLTHPGVYEIYRVAVGSGKLEQLTDLGGVNRYVLSPNESRLLITHSSALEPRELYVQRTKPGAQPTKITSTISETFTSIDWVAPEFVEIPSSHVNEPIHSRVYMPKTASTDKRPAVVFIHGAGYLQNAHQGWSGYFREFMFHSLLTQRGYVVLDMDYRASAGYGRDWRTAIYRQMGHPELEDLEDGVKWLVENRNVDPDRIGTYGGSYGGFLTLMALFTKPDLFACGAALRPVTDWAHYNHGYTSNILNTPTIDPSAFETSSPIEFAEGLTKPLIILHGMQDNNVFFQDSVRLVQRLIELEKEDWELAVYPIEAHGFREPSSWLDEYRRILKLFETHLKD